jgi:hypothetical protein
MKNAVFLDVTPCQRRFTQDVHGATSQRMAFFNIVYSSNDGIKISSSRCSAEINMTSRCCENWNRITVSQWVNQYNITQEKGKVVPVLNYLSRMP